MLQLKKIFLLITVFLGLYLHSQAQKPIIKLSYPPKGEKLYTVYIDYFGHLGQINLKDTTVFFKLPYGMNAANPVVAKKDYFLVNSSCGTGAGSMNLVYYLDKFNYKVFCDVVDIDTMNNLFLKVRWNKVKVVDYLIDTCIFYRTVDINDPEDYGMFPWNVLDYVKLSNGYLYIKFGDEHRDYRTKQFQGKDLYVFKVVNNSQKR